MVPVGFYFGEKRENNNSGALPLFITCLLTVGAMLASEVVAQILKPQAQNPPNQDNPLAISNLIPFSNLNLIFALGFFVRLLLWLFKMELVGVPLLSIQFNTMLICLLLKNDEAMKYLQICRRNHLELEQNEDIEMH